jgi:hypothetical protein
MRILPLRFSSHSPIVGVAPRPRFGVWPFDDLNLGNLEDQGGGDTFTPKFNTGDTFLDDELAMLAQINPALAASVQARVRPLKNGDFDAGLAQGLEIGNTIKEFFQRTGMNLDKLEGTDYEYLFDD